MHDKDATINYVLYHRLWRYKDNNIRPRAFFVMKQEQRKHRFFWKLVTYFQYEEYKLLKIYGLILFILFSLSSGILTHYLRAWFYPCAPLKSASFHTNSVLISKDWCFFNQKCSVEAAFFPKVIPNITN